MGSHLIDGEFQSDKYPTTPRGKVPLSVSDRSAQDLLWQYAQRRRPVDPEFSDDLETALRAAGFIPECKEHSLLIEWTIEWTIRYTLPANEMRRQAVIDQEMSIDAISDEQAISHLIGLHPDAILHSVRPTNAKSVDQLDREKGDDDESD